MNKWRTSLAVWLPTKPIFWVVVACFNLAACQTNKVNHDIDPKSLEENSLKSQIVRPPKDQASATVLPAQSQPEFTSISSQVGRVPIISDSPNTSFPISDDGSAPQFGAKTIDAYVPALPLPDFIDVVFGEILKTPYVTGPEVASRDDVIQLRSSGKMSADDFFSLTSEILEEYGVRVISEAGSYRVLNDKSLRSRMPVFIKSRARLRTRSDLRPVVQYVELQALEANSMLEFLRQAFDQRSEKLQIRANPRTNYITLVGLPEDVDAALAIIRELDALNFAGRNVRRYTPRYWDVYELTSELERALTAEGWQVSSNEGQLRPIFLMPVEYSNDIFVFTNSDVADERVATWMREFDRPIEGGDTAQIFIYQVKNVDAVNLVETANSVISKSGNAFASEDQRPDASRPEAAPLSGASASGEVFSVDPSGNRIIFVGSQSEYDRYTSLLERLDTPAPEVLIEVQIAEVTLTDNTSFGVEFFVDASDQSSNESITISTAGLGLGAAGATVGILSGNDVQAVINAFASNSEVKVLSTPILTARSGETATIQVGTDIPILTSQGVSPVQGIDGTTNIQQSVEYRSTGVLLTIEPIVFSDDRIDLAITQEVSATLDSSSGGISSPTISNRSLDTSLSLEDGETAVMGGLVQESYTRTDTGVPVLKDIPVVGKIFSNDSVALDRTELVILITAYVLRGQNDKAQFVNSLRNRVDNSLSKDDRLVTLVPKNL